MRLIVGGATKAKANTNLAHRASATEGEAAKRLLEEQGYPCKRLQHGQFEFRCPFHEGPGQIEPRKGTNFYLDASTSKYYCQSASCGERGNLRTLERFFGIEEGDSDEFASKFQSREVKLQTYEAALTPERRKVFYDHGLTDQTIARFRLGYDFENSRYVLPYLEGRRPVLFRFYRPDAQEGSPKYFWEEDVTARLFNPGDALGDKDGRVFLCEGEQKAMLLVQMGYAAVAVPGVMMWRDEWQAAFTHAKQILICFDNDNPLHHRRKNCKQCGTIEQGDCAGHNVGQVHAINRIEQLGWRAKNILLPLPDESARKTDINDFFMRDGKTNPDFAELAFGTRATPYKVQTLAQIIEKPPEEAVFLIEQGILPKGGRLLTAGKPKVGKSIFVDNLALSLAAGIPFLGKFKVDHPTRVLLLDRELSKRSLFDRLGSLIAARPGYQAAIENLLIDHDHLLKLDQKGAYDTLLQLVEQNGAEVLILDTAYKFFGGDVENASSLSRAFEVLDKIIHQTGCSVVMTHHHKKGQGGKGKENTDIADPDNVAGSFLWTGWPNATILLNYLSRSVENPYNSICTFTAFRDAAPPDPLALYRSRESIAYDSIQSYNHEDAESSVPVQYTKPSTEAITELLLNLSPITEDDFLHAASGHFGTRVETVRPYLLDALSQGHFERSSGRPPVLRLAGEKEAQSWEAEHGLPETTFENRSLLEVVS